MEEATGRIQQLEAALNIANKLLKDACEENAQLNAENTKLGECIDELVASEAFLEKDIEETQAHMNMLRNQKGELYRTIGYTKQALIKIAKLLDVPSVDLNNRQSEVLKDLMTQNVLRGADLAKQICLELAGVIKGTYLHSVDELVEMADKKQETVA
jgi:hypothetical protein